MTSTGSANGDVQKATDARCYNKGCAGFLIRHSHKNGKVVERCFFCGEQWVDEGGNAIKVRPDAAKEILQGK